MNKLILHKLIDLNRIIIMNLNNLIKQDYATWSGA